MDSNIVIKEILFIEKKFFLFLIKKFVIGDKGSLKLHLLGEATRKLNSDAKRNQSPFSTGTQGSPSTKESNVYPKDEFRTKIWSHFKFDKKIILNCL